MWLTRNILHWNWCFTQSLLFLFPVPDFVGFGILYSFGSVLTIMSTMFLVGPVKQIKNMLKKNRIIASVVYLTSIALTLYCAIALEDGVLVRDVLKAVRKPSAMHLLTSLNAFWIVCIGLGVSPSPVRCVSVVLLNIHPVWTEDTCQGAFVLACLHCIVMSQYLKSIKSFPVCAKYCRFRHNPAIVCDMSTMQDLVHFASQWRPWEEFSNSSNTRRMK